MLIEYLLNVFSKLLREKARINSLPSPSSDTISHCDELRGNSKSIFTTFVNLIIMRNVRNSALEAQSHGFGSLSLVCFRWFLSIILLLA